MLIYKMLIPACWLIFVIVWIVFSISAKKNVSSNRTRKSMYFRLAFIIIYFTVLRFFRIHRGNHMWHDLGPLGLMFVSPAITLSGIILCVAGIAFAIWARVYLGRNWGMPMSLKEDPKLITGGPYAYVRHPIYTGILLAMAGSALANSVLWLLPFVIMGPYLIYSAKTEEQIMMQKFPDEYPAYKKRTKMLIPFVL